MTRLSTQNVDNMSNTDDDCWYVLESDTDDHLAASGDDDPPTTTSGTATHVYGALPNSNAAALTVNGVSIVSWNVDGEEGSSAATPRHGKSGIRRASLAMKQGVSGSSYDLRSAIGLVNRVVVSPRIMINDCRASKLTEPANARKPIKRNGQVVVFVHTVFLKVGEIDTVNETFSADLYIQARWREPLFDNQTELNLKEIDWSTYWNPNLYVDNCAAQLNENIWYTVMFNANMLAYVFERRRVSGKFNEKLELYQFPFDTQKVTVRLVSERSVREVALEDDSGELSTVNAQSFVDEQEWRLYNSVETQQETVVRIYQGDNCFRPSFSTMCYASRRFGFYVWNIMFVMFFISTMAFTTFAVSPMKRENRLQLTFILLLTTITFKFAASSSLPRISYLTYLDKYILFSMVMLGSVCVWHAVIPSAVHNTVTSVDGWGLLGLASFFIIAHVAIFVVIYINAIRRRSAFVEKERNHKVKLKELHHRAANTLTTSHAGTHQNASNNVKLVRSMEERSRTPSIIETHI